MPAADLRLIAATVQELLNQANALSEHDGPVFIQDEILKTLERDTHRAMMQLKRRRNSSLTILINRLPAELLCTIFGHLRDPPSIHYLRDMQGSKTTSYQPLIAALLVCHKWYTIASHAASLWTDIDPDCCEWLLPRSSGANIQLYGGLTTKENSDALEKIVENHGTRIYELDLWMLDPVPSLRSILSTDMPHLRKMTICTSVTFSQADPESVPLTNVPGSFPALRALLLEGSPITTAHVLPNLTHLYLGQLWKVDVLDIVHLLRSTPALKVLHIRYCDELLTPLPSTVAPSSITLHCLREVHIQDMTSTAIHLLVYPLDAPALTFVYLSSILASDGTLASTPLLPSALNMWTINRLAVALRGSSFSGVFRGDNVSLEVGIAMDREMQHNEKWSWLRNDLPTMLPLSEVEELHFETSLWAAPASENLLAHLATYMPAVSTLVIKHDASHRTQLYHGAAVIALGTTVSGILTSYSPVLFPNLAHLELIVSDIPVELCARLARGLERRDQDGRRLQTLRIRVGKDHSSHWKTIWTRKRQPVWEETGIFDHVDSGELYPKLGPDLRYEDYSYKRDDTTTRLGWGKWKDCVERIQHEYWEE